MQTEPVPNRAKNAELSEPGSLPHTEGLFLIIFGTGSFKVLFV